MHACVCEYTYGCVFLCICGYVIGAYACVCHVIIFTPLGAHSFRKMSAEKTALSILHNCCVCMHVWLCVENSALLLLFQVLFQFLLCSIFNEFLNEIQIFEISIHILVVKHLMLKIRVISGILKKFLVKVSEKQRNFRMFFLFTPCKKSKLVIYVLLSFLFQIIDVP